MLGAVYRVSLGEVALVHALQLVGLYLNQNGSEGLSATRIRAGNPRPSRILGNRRSAGRLTLASAAAAHIAIPCISLARKTPSPVLMDYPETEKNYKKRNL